MYAYIIFLSRLFCLVPNSAVSLCVYVCVCVRVSVHNCVYMCRESMLETRDLQQVIS